MLMDADGVHLRPAAGPRLPKGWVEAITPLKIGPCIGSCGTAASLKQRVIVSDISTDPLWADYRDVALSYGLRAAWSQPLLSKKQEILGTFCVSYAEPRAPNETDLRLIEGAGHIAQDSHVPALLHNHPVRGEIHVQPPMDQVLCLCIGFASRPLVCIILPHRAQLWAR